MQVTKVGLLLFAAVNKHVGWDCGASNKNYPKDFRADWEEVARTILRTSVQIWAHTSNTLHPRMIPQLPASKALWVQLPTAPRAAPAAVPV